MVFPLVTYTRPMLFAVTMAAPAPAVLQERLIISACTSATVAANTPKPESWAILTIDSFDPENLVLLGWIVNCSYANGLERAQPRHKCLFISFPRHDR